MPFISVEKAVWSAKYHTGNERIDQQHQGLFETYNRLVAATCSEKNGQDANEVLVELADYVENHFRDEEEVWKVDAAILQKQRQAHAAFTLKVLEASKKDLRREEITGDLLAFIKKWLVDHIIKDDREDYQHLRVNGLI